MIGKYETVSRLSFRGNVLWIVKYVVWEGVNENGTNEKQDKL